MESYFDYMYFSSMYVGGLYWVSTLVYSNLFGTKKTLLMLYFSNIGCHFVFTPGPPKLRYDPGSHTISPI